MSHTLIHRISDVPTTSLPDTAKSEAKPSTETASRTRHQKSLAVILSIDLKLICVALEFDRRRYGIFFEKDNTERK